MYSTASTSRGEIEYRLEGHGPVVVVLNGGHCTRDTRLSHENLAREGFSVLTPSRPGYDSTPSFVGRTAQEAADAICGLLDFLNIDRVDMIGISAAGPTALAFALKHPSRLRKLILESAVSTKWDARLRVLSRVGFGRLEKLTWGLIKLILRLAPELVTRLMLQQLTTQNLTDLTSHFTPADLEFVRRMIETSGSGEGFVNDVDHWVQDFSQISSPVLVIYTPNDKFVPQKNALNIAEQIPHAQLYPVPAETHLLWIGKASDQVWQKRLAFLRS